MSGITETLRALYQGESALAHELAAAAERHTAEHEVHHVALDLANWSVQHGAVLASTAKRYGLQLPDSPDHSSEELPAVVRERTPELFGGRPQPGIVLLRDLRDLHLAATGNSLYWEMLGQAAQATRDGDLLGVVSNCHPQTLRQMRWTNTMIKVLSPQLLSAL